MEKYFLYLQELQVKSLKNYVKEKKLSERREKGG